MGEPAPPKSVQYLAPQPGICPRNEIDRRAADVVDVRGVLTHSDHASRREVGRGEVEMRKLRDGVADAFVD